MQTMVRSVNWWAITLRGVLAVCFGIATWAMPTMTLLVLIVAFGVYAIADGVFALVGAMRRTHPERRSRWLVLEGLLSILAGVIALAVPGLTALAALYLIALRAIMTGVLAIIAAVRMRARVRGEWLLGAGGALAILFGVLAIVYPAAGALSIVLWIGTYAIAFGVVLIAAGLSLRSAGRWRRGEVVPATPRTHPQGPATVDA